MERVLEGGSEVVPGRGGLTSCYSRYDLNSRNAAAMGSLFCSRGASVPRTMCRQLCASQSDSILHKRCSGFVQHSTERGSISGLVPSAAKWLQNSQAPKQPIYWCPACADRASQTLVAQHRPTIFRPQHGQWERASSQSVSQSIGSSCMNC